MRCARARRRQSIIEIKPAAPLALAEIAENALELHGTRPFGTAAQFRNALTTFLWGNRGGQSSSALTITGMPARVEIVPTVQIQVPTVDMQSAMRINRPPPPSFSNPIALAAAACAIALIAALGALWRGASAPAASPSSATEGEYRRLSPPHRQILPHQARRRHRRTRRIRVGTASTRNRCAAASARKHVTHCESKASGSEKGLVLFAVAPWGEVFVNGASEGTTPPLAQLQLPAGRHTIELRNGQRQPYVTQVDVVPGRPLRISHLFQ